MKPTMVVIPRSVLSIPVLLSTVLLLVQWCSPAASFLSSSGKGALQRNPTSRTCGRLSVSPIRRCGSSGVGSRKRHSGSYASSLDSSVQPQTTSIPQPELNCTKEGGVGIAIAKAWMAALLCGASIFGGPDVLRVGDEVASATGLQLAFGAQADWALSDEQDIINDVWRVVNAAYVDPTFNGQDWKAARMKALKKEYHGKDQAYAAAKDLLKVLGDPYTRFLTPQEYDAVTGLASGGVAGVGLELAATPPSSSSPASSSVLVAGVVAGSPAEKAGILTGDLLKAVDGEEAVGTSLDMVAGALRGDPGSAVRLDVKRSRRALAFPLMRAQFKYQGVKSEVKNVDGRKVGIISIKVFSKDTFEDVRAALAHTMEDGAQSILLDLRHNPGGFFPGGIDVARLFLPSDETIVSVVDRNGISDKYGTLAAGKFSEVPLVLVVDEKTASASEILSGALKDNGRATLAGHTTFGKAKVQTLNQIFDGSGVAVTISLYKTPSGADINGKGITVDYPSDCSYPGDPLACVPPDALR